jgi:hypothetical protein
VARDGDGTMFIVRDDGAAASLQDGVWRPGIPWSGRTLCDYRAVTLPEEVAFWLSEAEAALAASLQPARGGADGS